MARVHGHRGPGRKGLGSIEAVFSDSEREAELMIPQSWMRGWRWAGLQGGAE